MSLRQKNAFAPSTCEITARVDDRVHRVLKHRAKQLGTKPGPLAAALLEASLNGGPSCFERQVLGALFDAMARVTPRLLSCERILGQWLCEGPVDPELAKRLEQLLSQANRAAARSTVLENLCLAVAAGLFPGYAPSGAKRILDAQAAASKVLSAKNGGQPVWADEALLAEYLIAVGILQDLT
jgi:hypothetical protein